MNHGILHLYRVRYRYLEYRGISGDIPGDSGNRQTKATERSNNERVNERNPNTQRTTTKREHGTKERNKEGTRNDRKIPFQPSKTVPPSSPSLQHGVPILEVRRLEVRRLEVRLERNS